MAATPSSVVLLFLLVRVGCWASSNATTTQFYVATSTCSPVCTAAQTQHNGAHTVGGISDGKDSNPGTSPSEPLATVAGAQVKVQRRCCEIKAVYYYSLSHVVAPTGLQIRALKASHNGMLPGPVQVNIAPGW